MTEGKIIIFDFEVFPHDTLLGAKVISDKQSTLIQTWDLEEIKAFYYENVDAIWVGHNNGGYDNFILQAIVNGFNEEQVKHVSNLIIEDNQRYHQLRIPLVYYDLMQNHYVSLKTLEGYFGKNISETEVDFNTPRKLNDKEKRLTESYNRDDLDQTELDFKHQLAAFNLRVDSIKEFNLPMSCMNVSGTRLAEEVLGAKKTKGIENWVVKPHIYDTLQVENEEVKQFFLNDDFRTGKNVFVTLCGAEHKLGAGGIHAALKKYHTDHALYFDVSGYYNLVMINYDLLPRSIPAEGKEKYKQMYYDQLEMKKTGDPRRGAYKTILLSVFGAMMNEHCRFYDPYNGLLVTMTGQIFLVDLLEKLEGKVKVIQSNTDGIIVEPFDWSKKDEIIDIVKAWCERTGFVIKPKEIFDIYQRDVNCYLYKDENGEIQTLGEAVKDYGKWQWPFWKESYNSKEPVIMPECIVNYLVYHKKPEETIKENMRNLRMFQYLCKKLSYSWVEFEKVELTTGNVEVETLQNVNRAFALKSDEYKGMIYKYKYGENKKGETVIKKTKVSNLPDSVFVYNDEILSDEAVDTLTQLIDYDYYVARAYERIQEFIDIPQIKDITIYE